MYIASAQVNENTKVVHLTHVHCKHAQVNDNTNVILYKHMCIAGAQVNSKASHSCGWSTKIYIFMVVLQKQQDLNKQHAVFSRMRSQGSRFTLGVWGLRVCSLDVAQPSATVRNRPQPSATARNRPRQGHMAVLMVSSAEGVTFSGFTCGVASFRVAGVALRDNQTCFVTCRKSFCVAGATFFRRCIAVFVAGAALWTCPSSFCVAGAAYRVACFLRIALPELRQVATRRKFRGRRGILCDVMKINGSLAGNIDFEVANFQVLKKTRRKASILKLQSVKISWSLARNARFDAPMHVSRLKPLVFLWPRRVYGGSLQNLSFSKVSTQVVMSFCVAGAALCVIPTCLITVENRFLWHRHNTSASFSEDALQFSWQAQDFEDLCRILRGRRSTSQKLWLGLFLTSRLNLVSWLLVKMCFWQNGWDMAEKGWSSSTQT